MSLSINAFARLLVSSVYLLLFVWVSPVQASVYLGTSHLDIPSQIETASQIDQAQVADTTPTSRTHVLTDHVAIGSFYRSSLLSNSWNEDSPAPETLEYPSYCYPSNAYAPQPRPTLAWHATHIGSIFRLSGWKETNAFYVALNSQF